MVERRPANPAGEPTSAERRRPARATTNSIPRSPESVASSRQAIPTRRPVPSTLPKLPLHVGLLTHIKHFAKRLVRGWWAWELLSAAVALVATVALIILLVESNGRAQPSWAIGSTQLTLNTLVAALATIIRAALMLAVGGALNQSPWNLFAARKGQSQPSQGKWLKDLETFGEAASDSWNSAKLLCRTKGRYLASLGALITILSLAFDTFVQQVLVVDTENIPGPFAGSNISLSSAVLPRVQEYVNAKIPAENDDFPDASVVIKAAIIDGVLDNDTRPPVAQCPTGHCSWPVTPTIGVCSSCADVKGQLHSNQSDSNVTYSLSWPGNQFEMGHKTSTLILRSSPGGGDVATEVFSLATSSGTALQESGRLIIANFYAFGFSPLTYPNFYELVGPDQILTTGELDPLMVAYNCSFYFCLQGYSANSQNGNVQQDNVATWDQIHVLPGHLGDTTWAFDEAPTALNVPNASAYLVDGQSLTALGEAFEPIIMGNATLDTADEDLSFSGEDLSVMSAFVQSIFNASNSTSAMSARAQIIANSLTQHIRTTYPAAPDARYAPTIFTPQLLVRVRWGWLAYPLVLVAAGLVFLGLTILETRRRFVRPWKAHRIPLLLAHVSDSVRQVARGGLEKRTGLEDRVGEMRVRLAFDGKDEISFERA